MSCYLNYPVLFNGCQRFFSLGLSMTSVMEYLKDLWMICICCAPPTWPDSTTARARLTLRSPFSFAPSSSARNFGYQVRQETHNPWPNLLRSTFHGCTFVQPTFPTKVNCDSGLLSTESHLMVMVSCPGSFSSAPTALIARSS